MSREIWDGVASVDIDVYDAQVDAYTTREALRRAVALTAYVGDLIHGGTIDHTGGGKGARLAMPLGGASWPAVEVRADVTTGDLRPGTCHILAVPVRTMPGQTRVTLSTLITGSRDDVMQLRDATTWAIVTDSRMRRQGAWLTATVECSPATQYIITHTRDTSTADTLSGFVVGEQTDYAGTYATPASAIGTYSAATKVADGATIPDLPGLDAGFFADDHAMHAHLLTTLAREQNAIEEMLTGTPVGVSPALADSPTTHAYYDHSRLGAHRAGDALVVVPVFVDAYGAARLVEETPLAAEAGRQTLQWYSPGPSNSSTVTLREGPMQMPDVDDVLQPMSVRVLASSPSGKMPSSVSMTVTAQCIGHGAPVSTSTWTQIGTTQYYYADLDGIRFGRGAANNFRIQLTAGAGIDPLGSDFRAHGAMGVVGV